MMRLPVSQLPHLANALAGHMIADDQVAIIWTAPNTDHLALAVFDRHVEPEHLRLLTGPAQVHLIGYGVKGANLAWSINEAIQANADFDTADLFEVTVGKAIEVRGDLWRRLGDSHHQLVGYPYDSIVAISPQDMPTSLDEVLSRFAIAVAEEIPTDEAINQARGEISQWETGSSPLTTVNLAKIAANVLRASPESADRRSHCAVIGELASRDRLVVDALAAAVITNPHLTPRLVDMARTAHHEHKPALVCAAATAVWAMGTDGVSVVPSTVMAEWARPYAHVNAQAADITQEATAHPGTHLVREIPARVSAALTAGGGAGSPQQSAAMSATQAAAHARPTID